PLRRHHDLRSLRSWRRALAQEQGQTQAADDPRLCMPDVGGAGALAGRPLGWTVARLCLNAAVPHRRRSVRPMVTRTCPPGVLVGAWVDRVGHPGACRPARQPRMETRHAVTVRLACTSRYPGAPLKTTA